MVFQFCVENPSTGALRAQPFMQEMMRYSTTVDYCQYKSLTEDGEWVTYAYRKPTLLCTNVPGAAEINRRCNCEGKRHASSLIGDKARGKRHTYGQGKKLPLPSKHAVPTELQIEVLSRAQTANPQATWVLDLFSGTQSLKVAAGRLKLKYVGVDIEEKVRVDRVDRVGSVGSTTKGTSRFVETDIVKDLQESDVRQVIKEASLLAGEREDKLLLVWASPPCTTFSQCQTLLKPEKRHRDYSVPHRPAISDHARRDDALVSNLVAQLTSLG